LVRIFYNRFFYNRIFYNRIFTTEFFTTEFFTTESIRNAQNCAGIGATLNQNFSVKKKSKIITLTPEKKQMLWFGKNYHKNGVLTQYTFIQPSV
jgi:hypothetical protein